MPLCFMLRTATCLCVLQVLFALRDPEVAHLIPDEPTFIDTPTVPASSAIVTASEEVPQVQDLEVDLSKIDLAELEELPNCINGELRLSARVYKVTRHVEIQGPCNVTADGTTLLVTATLKFVETARLDGKLSVRAMNPLQGPCLAFKSDAFVAASAELHFANCENSYVINWDLLDLMQISASDAEAAEVDGDEVDGGAMSVRGSLMVMGTLIIRDCRTWDGNGGAIAVKQHFVHSSGNISIINSLAVKNGGGICVYDNFINLGGKIEIFNSSAEESGGGIYVAESFNNSGGKIEVSNSLAKRGGGIYVAESFNNSGGKIEVSNSSAHEDGGGIFVHDNFEHSGGKIQISGSSAKNYGGGIYVYDNFTNLGGKIEIFNSSAEESGGAVLRSSS